MDSISKICSKPEYFTINGEASEMKRDGFEMSGMFIKVSLYHYLLHNDHEFIEYMFFSDSVTKIYYMMCEAEYKYLIDIEKYNEIETFENEYFNILFKMHYDDSVKNYRI